MLFIREFYLMLRLYACLDLDLDVVGDPFKSQVLFVLALLQ